MKRLWERLFPKNWLLVQDLGWAGIRTLSEHRTRSGAVMAIRYDPADPGTYRVMQRDLAVWFNSEECYRLERTFVEGEKA